MALSLPDSDITEGPWEKVRDGVQRNLDALARAVIGTGNQQLQIRSGIGTAAFAASASSSTVTVDHGLGGTPARVIVSSVAGAGVIFTAPAADWAVADFKVNGYSAPGPLIGDIDFAWIAIG